MYAKTARDVPAGPLLGNREIQPEFTDSDGTIWSADLGCLDAPHRIPLGAVAEEICVSVRSPQQLRVSREGGVVFPVKATPNQQEIYRLHRELKEMTAQRNTLLEALTGMLDAFHYDPDQRGQNHAINLAEDAVEDAKGCKQ